MLVCPQCRNHSSISQPSYPRNIATHMRQNPSRRSRYPQCVYACLERLYYTTKFQKEKKNKTRSGICFAEAPTAARMTRRSAKTSYPRSTTMQAPEFIASLSGVPSTPANRLGIIVISAGQPVTWLTINGANKQRYEGGPGWGRSGRKRRRRCHPPPASSSSLARGRGA